MKMKLKDRVSHWFWRKSFNCFGNYYYLDRFKEKGDIEDIEKFLRLLYDIQMDMEELVNDGYYYDNKRGDGVMEINLNDIWLDNSVEAEIFRDNLIKECQDTARINRLSKEGYGYYLDNCGDGKWYCDHCLQEDCTKRM